MLWGMENVLLCCARTRIQSFGVDPWHSLGRERSETLNHQISDCHGSGTSSSPSGICRGMQGWWHRTLGMWTRWRRLLFTAEWEVILRTWVTVSTWVRSVNSGDAAAVGVLCASWRILDSLAVQRRKSFANSVELRWDGYDFSSWGGGAGILDLMGGRMEVAHRFVWSEWETPGLCSGKRATKVGGGQTLWNPEFQA